MARALLAAPFMLRASRCQTLNWPAQRLMDMDVAPTSPVVGGPKTCSGFRV